MITDPRALLISELHQLYNSETTQLPFLATMANASYDEELANAFNLHYHETEEHAGRLKSLLRGLGRSTESTGNRMMEGFIEEGQISVLTEAIPMLKDALLIAVAKKIASYEIASYGWARTLADLMGEYGVADIMEEILDDKKANNLRLSGIASMLNLAEVFA